VVVAPNQLGSGEAPEAYALDVNALSLFGDGLPNQNKFSLSGYGRYLSTPRGGFPGGISPGVVVTRLSLDSNSSVPKLFFGVATNDAGRASFLNESQVLEVMALAKTEAVTRLVEASTDELVSAGIPENPEPAFAPAPAPVAVTSPPPPPPPKAPTWQEAAAENGADEDDIELIEAAGGPYTEKGRKRWDKVVDVDPPEQAAAPTEKPKKAKIKPEVAAEPETEKPKKANPFGATSAPAPAEAPKKGNPFGAAPAPATASAPAKPAGVSAEVGAKLANKLSAFDDE
jgi:hypothetical protein